jgi:hypothetical protein
LTLLIKCVDTETFYNPEIKLFEVPSNIKYKEMQELVNKKYNNTPIKMIYINEQDERITIDSDLVLSKTIQKFIREAYESNSKEVTVMILVHKLACCKKQYEYIKVLL